MTTEAFYNEVGALRDEVWTLRRENERLRERIGALIEVYAPPERKKMLRFEHLGEWPR